MQSSYILYEYWRSSCSWRVRWALAHKAIAYTSVHVDLLRNEQNHLEFLQKNPAGAVPALQTPTGCFAESFAILEWLEEKHPAKPLLPVDPDSRLYVPQFALSFLPTS